MKPFDLEKALAGEPVVTRKGEKAFILSNLNNLEDKRFNPDYPLVGIIQNRIHVCCWTLEGRIALQNNEALGDIVGMWEEPSPRVQLNLPCPVLLLEVGKRYYTINVYDVDCYDGEMGFTSIEEWVYEDADDCQTKSRAEQGLMFASRTDAQEWLNAMRNSRR